MQATLSSDTSSTNAAASQTGFSGGVSLSYDAATGAYTVRDAGGLTQTFAAGDRQAGRSNSSISVYQKSDGTIVDDLVLFNPGAGNGFALSYVSFGSWQRLTPNVNTVSAAQQYFVYGIRQAADQPSRGFGTYQTIVDGLWTDTSGTYSLAGVSNFSADFSNLTVSTSLDLAGTHIDTKAPRDFGFFNGTGTIAALGGGFSGTFSQLGDTDGSVYSGGFNGAFFGPTGQEVGYTFSLTSGTGAAVGAVVGKAQ